MLPVETGRWENTSLEDRKCTLCSKHDIGDEFHYLFVCDHFISEKEIFKFIFLQKSKHYKIQRTIFFSKYQEACKVIKFCRNYNE